MRKLKKYLLCMVMLSPLALLHSAFAGPNYIAGNISNITSTTAGLLLIVDTGVPDNCVGTPFGWIIIPESNKTMIAVTLMLVSQGKKNAVVYTSGKDATGWCIAIQVDPIDY